MFGILKNKLKQIVGKLRKKRIVEEKVEEPKKAPKKELKKKTVRRRKIREEELEEIKLDLVRVNVPLDTAEKICTLLKTKLEKGSRGKIETLLKEILLEILDQEKIDFIDMISKNLDHAPLILFLGYNGSGKTTTIAKIGYLLKQFDIPCVFAAADTFRAAAIEQLEYHARKLGIKVIKHTYKADPAAVIFDAKKYAADKKCVVLADTSGRVHTDKNLMEEIKKICRVNNPDLKILVVDALTGNDIINQVREFDEAVKVDALIITKADVDEKGGAILAARDICKKPILFLGVGQEYKDLKEFDAKEIVSKLLG